MRVRMVTWARQQSRPGDHKLHAYLNGDLARHAALPGPKQAGQYIFYGLIIVYNDLNDHKLHVYCTALSHSLLMCITVYCVRTRTGNIHVM